MKKVKKIHPAGFYIFSSKSSSNTPYFENLKDINVFKKIMERNFRWVLNIYEYLINEEGWMMAVKIQGEEDLIRSKYKRFCKSNTDRAETMDIWQIISDLMRCALSEYVIKSNRLHGQTGVRVHSSYERFYFDSLEESLEYLDKLRKAEIRQCQQLRRYRSSRKLYRKLLRLGNMSIFLSSKKLREKGMRWNKGVKIWDKIIDFQELNFDVLRKLIDSTNFLHNSPHPPP